MFHFQHIISVQLGELIPIPADSPPPPALSSNVSSCPALLLAPSLVSIREVPLGVQNRALQTLASQLCMV